jgi:hypothetical protein
MIFRSALNNWLAAFGQEPTLVLEMGEIQKS